MMKYRAALALLVAVCAVTAVLPRAEEAPKWKLTWSDEFDGKQIDRKKWDFDLGNGFYDYDANVWISGWGNNERQYYTREPENASVRDGHLVLRAVKESYHGCGYTSAKLRTRKRDGTALFAQKYGRFEIRAKCPTGKGIWPAIWMLPQDEKYGGWGSSGEIDILEARGQKPGEVLGTLHFGSRWPANTESSTTYTLPERGTIADWHVYALEWEPGEIRWYVDDKLSATQSSWWSSSKVVGDRGARPTKESDLNPWLAPFDQPFYLILNLAVGGKFLGNPDKTTPFPAEMLVDYVRAYERVGGYGPPKPRGPGKLPFKTP
jgi:beta-glucanase (GH16 family)